MVFKIENLKFGLIFNLLKDSKLYFYIIMNFKNQEETVVFNFEDYKKKVLKDYYTIVLSRETSVLAKRSLSGKGKFGIFGDGKELPQIAMNHFFENGDFRSGYYRDQTF